MKRLVLLFISIVAVCSVNAQNADVDALNERIAKLEKRAQVWDKIKPAFKFSGYIQAGYDYLWNEDGTSTSTLHLRRARLSMQGDIYNGPKGAKASYRLQIDLCKELPIMDLWAKYQPVNQFGVQFGQFKVPISIENTDYNATQLEFINYALPVQRLVRMSSSDMQGINSSGRDIGMQLYGGFIKRDGFSIINYELGVFNGSGINTKDSNKSKDIAARITIQPLKKLKIAAYYMGGETNATALLSKYQGIVANSGVNVEYLDYNRYGGGVDYSNKYIFARAEYLGGQTGEYLSGGLYAQVGYKFLDKCSVGVRYAFFDENLNANSLEQSNYSVALSYHPWKHLRVQAEYTRQVYENLPNAVASSDFKKSDNCLYFMVTALF